MLKKIEDYPAYLEAHWQEHLLPRPDNSPTVISTFAGCGGSSLGYSMAGFRELLAVEWDGNAVETFKVNFPGVPVYHGDITKLSADDVFQLTGLRPGELDVFDGSPPCQGFSTADKRQLDDPRNQLFKEYVRLLRGLKPKVFIMENVSGMVKGVMKLAFAEILRDLKASGYKVSARLLNAMYFGVPQSRQRMIFVGVRDDLGIEPTHPVAENELITVGMAWRDIVLSESERIETKLTELYQQYWHESSQGHSVGKLDKNRRLAVNKPSQTLQKSEGSGGAYHPTECRALCTRELKRLQSFCDDFIFYGNRRDAIQRIGNSVPPLLMRSIALHVKHNILYKISTDSRIV